VCVCGKGGGGARGKVNAHQGTREVRAWGARVNGARNLRTDRGRRT